MRIETAAPDLHTIRALLKIAGFRYCDGNTYTDYWTKREAIAAMIRQNGGQVWTSDGEHLVAWLTSSDETYLHVVDLRSGQTRIRVL